MSNDKKNPYHYDPFDYEIEKSSLPLIFNYGASSLYNNQQDPQTPHHHQTLHGFDESDGHNHPSFMTFTDCLHGSMADYNSLSKAFDMPCSSAEVITPPLDHHHDNTSTKIQQQLQGTGTTENYSSTPNSSVSSSSNEASAADPSHEHGDSDKNKNSEKQPKVGSYEAPGDVDDDDNEDKSKKGSKAIKKKEKRQREPRFAFLTKSEVDHLEDGYRWRKYGQKAVKNSPYPRSYYRCTTQKCIVKKRVERSFQDPTIVITTYEGQHNHQCPATLRGNLNLNTVGMLSPSSLFASASINGGIAGSTRLPHDFLAQFLPMNNQLQMQNHHRHLDYHAPISSNNNNPMLYSSLLTPHQHRQQQQQHVPDYGLLQDLVPSFGNNKQEP